MTHTDDLRERVTELTDRLALNTSDHERGGMTTEEYLAEARETADRIIAAVQADIAARALSDEVQVTVGDSFESTLECVDLYDESDPASPCEHLHAIRDPYEVVRNITTALLTVLGITESEAETP